MHRTMMAALAATLVLSTACASQLAKLVIQGDQRGLRKRPEGSPKSSPDKPPILILAIDGVGRDLLYGLLRQGKLPNLASLLGGARGKFPHAHFDERMLSTLPSSTMVAWMTTMTGEPPAVHGVTGNEFFIREKRTFACPAPVSFTSATPTLAIYTEGYLDSLGSSPSVYERMREKDPDVLIWVGMHSVFRGADVLMLSEKTRLVSAFEGAIENTLGKPFDPKAARRVYEELDAGAIDVVVGELEKDGGTVPDVLTLYISGADLYAHVAEEGPDEAQRSYLEEVLDPRLGKLVAALRARDALARRWVMVTADHGHTQVVFDDAHALSTKADEDPPDVLRRIGFRVRSFERDVPETDPFTAVLAYGGAMAYVYLADRSRCPSEKDVCDWKQPPRHEEDVLAAAEAFHKNNQDGSIVPAMKGTLDMILTRKPKPFAEIDAPFEVYLGDGKTVPVDVWLKDNPHPSYVAVDARLRDLAVGVHGERAGDILLIAHNGDRDDPKERYYFAAPLRSWHGSPSKRDSELPFIVSNPAHSGAAIGSWVTLVLGERPFQQKTTDVLLEIRAGAAPRK